MVRNIESGGNYEFPTDPNNNDTRNQSLRQGGRFTRGLFEIGNSVTSFLRSAKEHLDFAQYTIHELVTNPGRIYRRALKFSPTAAIAALEVFTATTAVAAVATAEAAGESEEYKIIEGRDGNGKLVRLIELWDGKDSNPIDVVMYPQKWSNSKTAIRGGKQAIEGFKNTHVISEYANRFRFWMYDQDLLNDLGCGDNSLCRNPSEAYKAIDSANAVLAKTINKIAVGAVIFTKGGVPAGWTGPSSEDVPPSIDNLIGVVYPEYEEEPTGDDQLSVAIRKSRGKVLFHEMSWNFFAFKPVTDDKEKEISITMYGDKLLPREEKQVRDIMALNNGNFNARFQTPGYNVSKSVRPTYSLSSVGDSTKAGIKIDADIPVATTQVKMEVTPSKSPVTNQPDGPAIQMHVGDKKMILDMKDNGGIFIPTPNTREGRDFTILPDSQYKAEVCVSTERTWLDWSSPKWEETIEIWPNGLKVTNKCQVLTFNTMDIINPNSATISSVGYDQKTNSLKWADSNEKIFYYEVQVSGDKRFDPNPETATSFVYWNLIHGGITNNSYELPKMEPGTYFWRVRPRVQGDPTVNKEVAWSETWSVTIP